jgi:CxxC-x17-CxxC domain-containing protein
MNNYTSGHKGAGQKFTGKKTFGGDTKKYNTEHRTGSNKTEQFSATCSECHKKCDVPFKPSQDKPVYCSACFGMKKSGNELRGERNTDKRERKPFGNGQVNNGPAFSSAPAGPSAQNILELKQQISALEVKLNKILDLLNPPRP